MNSADILHLSKTELDFGRLSQDLAASPAAVRAVCQILLHHLDMSREHEIIIETSAEARHYNAGSAGTCTDLLNEILALSESSIDVGCLAVIRERFPLPKMAQSKAE